MKYSFPLILAILFLGVKLRDVEADLQVILLTSSCHNSPDLYDWQNDKWQNVARYGAGLSQLNCPSFGRR
ncbi:hypothetical protein Poly24_28090 [Rosistilla carotiformis]|uniref:Uncharacterized protein n=1 Tax=Rosistilla carotiformis TaxID=2528017 RepID=A0A518JU88_9BACT|nr:hypothetical protein [Rosistilla carotiformis]QDV69095.1 hypothetical protein Poly24_28090 [Rosistilla carotiformis]